ncbi:MAG: cytochrome b/b6 domain-containing protein [bacterium]
MADMARQVPPGGATPPGGTAAAARESTVVVWDPLVRVFHWSLVGAFALAWLTGDELERLHEVTGYVIVGLLGIRIVWGVVGTTHARFSDFLYRPCTVVRNLGDTARFRAKRYLGHSPAGGAMVIALMLTLAVTAGTGILMTTNGGEWLEEIHKLPPIWRSSWLDCISPASSLPAWSTARTW